MKNNPDTWKRVSGDTRKRVCGDTWKRVSRTLSKEESWVECGKDELGDLIEVNKDLKTAVERKDECIAALEDRIAAFETEIEHKDARIAVNPFTIFCESIHLAIRFHLP
jgi:hypothetical protein